MTAPEKTEKLTPIQLKTIFDTALSNAESLLLIALRQEEPLFGTAKNCYFTLRDARDALGADGTLPYVSGNDPHSLDAEERTPLANTLSAIYGFGSAGVSRYPSSQHSIAALNALRPIADTIHTQDLAICT